MLAVPSPRLLSLFHPNAPRGCSIRAPSRNIFVRPPSDRVVSYYFLFHRDIRQLKYQGCATFLCSEVRRISGSVAQERENRHTHSSLEWVKENLHQKGRFAAGVFFFFKCFKHMMNLRTASGRTRWIQIRRMSLQSGSDTSMKSTEGLVPFESPSQELGAWHAHE